MISTTQVGHAVGGAGWLGVIRLGIGADRQYPVVAWLAFPEL